MASKDKASRLPPEKSSPSRNASTSSSNSPNTSPFKVPSMPSNPAKQTPIIQVEDSATGIVRAADIPTDAALSPLNPPKAPDRPLKISLAPGHSIVDWMNLCKGRDMTGGGGPNVRRLIGKEELAKHDTVEDAWMGIRGRCYKIDEFYAYHPGGGEVLDEHLGTDGTSMFQYYHSFVNEERLLGPCQVGRLDRSTFID